VYGDAQGYWFDLMNQYHGMGVFLSWVSVVTTILYFVTSSDSGSLVVDLIAANGAHPHVVQRVVWAISEGAVCIALLSAGGSDALSSLQAISIVMGLPFTIVLMLVCTSLWRALKIDAGDMKPINERVDWTLPLYGGIFDVIEKVFSCGRAPMPTASSMKNFMLGLFCPVLPLQAIASKMAIHSKAPDSNMVRIATIGATSLFFLLFIVFHILTLAFTGFYAYAWFCYIAFATLVTVQRHAVRAVYKIEGSGPEDFFATLFLYPQVLAQMAEQVQEVPVGAEMAMVDAMMIGSETAKLTPIEEKLDKSETEI